MKDVILGLLLDEKDPEKKFRKAIFDEKLKFVGVAKNEFKKQSLITFILADNVEELKEKHFMDSLLEEINILRTSPKNYIKFFETLLENIPNTNGAKKANAYKLITFLKNTRFFGGFQTSELLTKAAENRLAYMKELGEVKKHSLEDVKVFLSDHLSGYQPSCGNTEARRSHTRAGVVG